MPDCAAPSLRIADLLCHATKRLRAAGVESPARDARLLLAHSLGVAHPALLDRQHSVSEAQAQTFEERIARRAAREPVSRIKGFREFWGMDFVLSADTLDPRPDTETLVEATLATFGASPGPGWILDLGTGSGCILCALLKEWPTARGVGVERSKAAIVAGVHCLQHIQSFTAAAFANDDAVWAHT